MMTISFDDIFDDVTIEETLKDLESKRDSCGTDGVYLSQLREYWEINGKEFLEALRMEKYEPGIIREIEILNGKGKRRTIALYNSIDRMILRCLSQKIQKECDELLENNCFAFRDGFGVEAAVKLAVDYMNDGYTWMAKYDVSNYYDSISVSKLEEMLKNLLSDAKLRRLIIKYLHPEVEREDGSFYYKGAGIIQGSSLSPFLSNIYLSSLDREMVVRKIRYCRFADDICAFFKDKQEASDFYAWLLNKMSNEYNLHHNKEKSGVFEGTHQQYLGYQFIYSKKNKCITAQKPQRKKPDQIYHAWQRNAIQKIDRDYHIINDGILTKRDYNVLFDNENGKKYIPVETARALNVHSNITFSSDFFRFVGSRNLDVNIFDRYGNYVGSFVPAGNGFRGRTMLRQVEMYIDNARRIQTAKAMEIGSLHNIRANLRYYYKHKKTQILKEAVDQFSQYIIEINNSNTINEMMLVEARARELYYRMINEIISNEDFHFTTRTKRPPKDPINALISFGNVYLYNRIATEINKTSLDIRIGFVHSTTNRSQSLNLDLADIFKPIIVDRVIFSLINLKMINANDFFQQEENGAIYLNKEGKRLFINALDNKIYEKQTEDNHPLSYETRIRNEVQKVFRLVMYGEKYKPYKYQ